MKKIKRFNNKNKINKNLKLKNKITKKINKINKKK